MHVQKPQLLAVEGRWPRSQPACRCDVRNEVLQAQPRPGIEGRETLPAPGWRRGAVGARSHRLRSSLSLTLKPKMGPRITSAKPLNLQLASFTQVETPALWDGALFGENPVLLFP